VFKGSGISKLGLIELQFLVDHPLISVFDFMITLVIAASFESDIGKPSEV